MKASLKSAIIIICILFGCENAAKNESEAFENSDNSALVDPLIGAGKGNVFVGASVPFGLVKLGPDTEKPQATNGYKQGKSILGFSHTHSSGTGGSPRYGNILVTPQTGKFNLADFASLKQSNEYAKPGLYGVTLARKTGDVSVRLTASEKVGVHEYSFFTWDKKDSLDAHLIFDIAHSLSRGREGDSHCTSAEIKINSATELEGSASFAGGWGGENPFRLYFYAKVDVPSGKQATWSNDSIDWREKVASWEFGTNESDSIRAGAILSYRLAQKGKVLLKMGVSIESVEAASKSLLESEEDGFESYRKSSSEAWEQYLSKVAVKGGLPEHQALFYSALRNTLVMPTQVSEQEEKPFFWDHYCLWDVHRTVMPLHLLLYPEKQREIVNSLLTIYETRGWLPDGWVAGDFAQIQGGTTADIVLADAIIKDLGGFNEKVALEAMLKNATEKSYNPSIYGRYLENYSAKGYVLPSEVKGAVSRTLEYAYSDYVISQAAEHIGENANELAQRSYRVFQLFNQQAGQFWGKDVNGNWMDGIRKKHNRGDTWNDPYFYETAPDIYSTYVPHAMDSLIALHGGKDAYESYLDQLFEDGFELENEPGFLVPYQYLYTNAPWKTAEKVHEILASFQPSADGWPGQDDSGALSAWYVWSSLGIFPVTGQAIYLIGIPLFEHAQIQLENGVLKISASNSTHQNQYVKSIKLNGKEINRYWLKHDEIKNGGSLVFEF